MNKGKFVVVVVNNADYIKKFGKRRHNPILWFVNKDEGNYTSDINEAHIYTCRQDVDEFAGLILEKTITYDYAKRKLAGK